MRQTLISLLFLLSGIRANTQPYTNFALEGGGIRGLAYAGAYRTLEERGITTSIRKVAGTSVGAAVASLICAGYAADELQTAVYGLRVQMFNDGRGMLWGGQQRLRKQYGWYRGEALERWINEKLSEKTGVPHLTFRLLHERAMTENRFKDLYVTASNISAQRLTVFSWESYPDMEIATAVTRQHECAALFPRALPRQCRP